MSLVNDVLKDLNRRNSKTEKAMPIQALQIESVEQQSFNVGRLLMVIGLILALIIIAQLILNKPISKLFSKPVVSQETETQLVVQEAISKVVAIVETEIENDIQANVNVIADEKPIRDKKLPVGNQVETKNSSLPQPLVIAEAEVVKVKSPGIEEYQLALKAYKEQRYNLAMNWIDSAIAKQIKSDYQLLKARIYIQNKDATGLYEYVLDHSEIANQEWLKLVAPGLQIFGYHQLSNKYYQALIKQYPEQVKYQLAMALNYSRLGEYGNTYRIYHDLSLSQQMTKKQKRWLTAQLTRLDSRKAQHGS